MPPRKSTKPNPINPTAVTTAALKACKCSADYNRISNTTESTVLEAAWKQLPESEQQRIIQIVNDNTSPAPDAIASELAACSTYLELQAIKSEFGEPLVRQAWKLLPSEERDRIKTLCDNGQKEEVLPVTEQPSVYKVETPTPKRTLFNISDDLQLLNGILDDCGDDSQQQQLVNDWLEQLGDERDQKLDNYSALIMEITTRAAARKAEAQRLMELVATDENRARLLRERLKWFFETHNLKTVNTARYRLSVAKNGGRAPLVIDETVPVTQLPEQFQKVSIDANTAAIREALEAGEVLNFAHLGERGTSLRIK